MPVGKRRFAGEALSQAAKGGGVDVPRLIIAGGRDFTDRERLFNAADQALQELGGRARVVSGMARGADSLGIEWAKARGLEWDEYPAQWRQNGQLDRSAGYKRNEQMAQNADAVLLMPGGKGTDHMANIAQRYGLTVFDRRQLLEDDVSAYSPRHPGNKGLRGPYSSFEIVKAPFRGADPVKHGFDVWGMRGDRGETMEQVRPGEKGWLGNPYKAVDAGGALSREEAVSRFNDDFLKRVAEDSEYRQAVLGLKGKRVAYYKPDEGFIHLHPIQQWLSEQPDAAPQPAVSPPPAPQRQRPAGSSEFAGGLQLVLPIVGIGTGVGAAAYVLASLYQGQQRQQ